MASRRFGPYLSQDDHGRPYLDKAKIRRAEQLDGKFVLTTNDDTLSAADIALGYKGMWIIEACFRRLKTTGLGIRPMFHWTPRRIVAHVKLCVLALMIQRAAEIATGAPWSQLVDVLERLKAVRYTTEGETMVQASRIGPELAAILKKLDIARPSRSSRSADPAKTASSGRHTPPPNPRQRPEIAPRFQPVPHRPQTRVRVEAHRHVELEIGP